MKPHPCLLVAARSLLSKFQHDRIENLLQNLLHLRPGLWLFCAFAVLVVVVCHLVVALILVKILITILLEVVRIFIETIGNNDFEWFWNMLLAKESGQFTRVDVLYVPREVLNKDFLAAIWRSADNLSWTWLMCT